MTLHLNLHSAVHKPRSKIFKRRGKFAFFELPTEIRNQIYALTFPQPETLHTARPTIVPKLLQTCRRTRKEATEFLHASTDLVIHVDNNWRSRVATQLSLIGAKNLSKVRTISFILSERFLSTQFTERIKPEFVPPELYAKHPFLVLAPAKPLIRLRVTIKPRSRGLQNSAVQFHALYDLQIHNRAHLNFWQKQYNGLLQRLEQAMLTMFYIDHVKEFRRTDVLKLIGISMDCRAPEFTPLWSRV